MKQILFFVIILQYSVTSYCQIKNNGSIKNQIDQLQEIKEIITQRICVLQKQLKKQIPIIENLTIEEQNIKNILITLTNNSIILNKEEQKKIEEIKKEKKILLQLEQKIIILKRKSL